MSESNSDWGALAEQDAEMADAWDACSTLPEPGDNAALDAFCERKNIDIPSLIRLGARMRSPTVLAFAFPGGVKFRDVETGKRWNMLGSEFHQMKIVRGV